MTQRSSPEIETRIAGAESRRSRPPSVRLALAAVAVIALAGCTTSPASPSAPESPITSAVPSASASPAATPTATSTPQPTPAPAFVATGSMHVARMYATATLLKNGKVLIAGGNNGLWGDGEVDYASTELYDPATGKFTTTGSMTVARAQHAAALLEDGRVLIVGGAMCSDPACVDSAELYDPTTGKFTRTDSMNAGSLAPTATRLLDGKVLVTQGESKWAELYDPDSGRFDQTGEQVGFPNPVAVLLQDGRVLVTGGASGYTDKGALYDEASGKFTMVSFALAPGAAPTAQYNGAAVEREWPESALVLKDGRVLLFEGGYLVTYNPATGACAGAGFVSPQGIWLESTATQLPDGRMLFAGGSYRSADYGEQTPAAAVLFDPVSGSQTAVSMAIARVGHTATLLSNGSVLIAGGMESGVGPLSSAVLFKP